MKVIAPPTPTPPGVPICSPPSPFSADKAPFALEKSPFPLLPDFVCSSSTSSREQHHNLACGKLNCGNAHHSFVPLPGMPGHNLCRRQTGFSQQSAVAEESEPCLSSLSQAHDLCSPGSAISGTISPNEPSSSKQPAPHTDKGNKRFLLNDASFQAMAARLVCPSNFIANATYLSNVMAGQLQLTEGARQNQDTERKVDDLYAKPKESAVALFPTVCVGKETGMQGVTGGHKAQTVHNQETLIPFTDLRLLHPSMGPPDALIPLRNRLESPVVSIASTGAQPRELSSFQSFPITPAWSSGDQVFNRKRPWVLTQEPTGNLESRKGVDLNASVDEIESESKDQGSPATNGAPVSCTSSLSAKMYSVSSALKADYFSSSSNGSPFLSTNGSPFLSIMKGSLDYDASYILEAETSGDFLTLGPSTSLRRMHDHTSFGNGSHSHRFLSSDADKFRSSNEDVSIWQPRKSCPEQGKSCDNLGRLLPAVSRVSSSDDVLMRTEEDVQSEQYGLPLHVNVGLSACVSWTKVEDNSAQLHPNAAGEGSLDLELRLSL